MRTNGKESFSLFISSLCFDSKKDRLICKFQILHKLTCIGKCRYLRKNSPSIFSSRTPFAAKVIDSTFIFFLKERAYIRSAVSFARSSVVLPVTSTTTSNFSACEFFSEACSLFFKTSLSGYGR